MARVEIELNGRFYAVGCEDGQENRLREIAAFVDTRMRALAGDRSNVSEPQTLVLTLLTLADQMFDLKAELARARTSGSKESAEGAASLPAATEERYASFVEALAARVDAVASRLARV
jgi:cell division protein ZapA